MKKPTIPDQIGLMNGNCPIPRPAPPPTICGWLVVASIALCLAVNLAQGEDPSDVQPEAENATLDNTQAIHQTGWLGWTQFEDALKTLPKSHYPIMIQGRPLPGDGTQWRAFFAPIPNDQFEYRIAFGKNDGKYSLLQKQHTQAGFALIDHQNFVAMSGTLHQAVWGKNLDLKRQNPNITAWLSEIEFDKALKALPKTHYPIMIRGRVLEGGETQWQAFFAPTPNDISEYRVVYGKNLKEYSLLEGNYHHEGFTTSDHPPFISTTGMIWVKTKLRALRSQIVQLPPEQRTTIDPLVSIQGQSAAVRYRAIEKLDASHSEKHAQALLIALDDDVRWLRYAAAVRLADARLHLNKIAPILVESLGYDDHAFFLWNMKFVKPALHKIAGPALPYLATGIDSPNLVLRKNCCDVLLRMPSITKNCEFYQKPLEALNQAIASNKDPSLRPMYVTVRMKFDGDIDLAEKLIREDARSKRREAFEQMEHFDSEAKRFLPLIIKILEEQNDFYYIYPAVNALWRIHENNHARGDQIDLSSCMPAIVEQLKKQKGHYQLEGQILRFLSATNNAKHCPVELIIGILSSKDRVINHYAAVEVLKAMGESARPALPALREMQNSSRTMRKDLRKEITVTIQQLTRP